ncbi:MAG: putative metal-binding motif-containing protein [Myxococcota bacterium]|jgi:hypothetical protein|nr:putative metal-binding motif-containing protein [Myxococcota bacterium]
MRFASSTRLSVWGRRGARTSVALLPLVVGCGLSLDLSAPDPRRGDGAVEIDGGTLDGGERDGSFDASRDGSLDGDVDAWMPPDAGSCVEVSECEMRERSGAPTTCEAWACIAGRCVENDYDGDGYGPGCEDDRDCDDFDPTITLDGVVSCPDDRSRPGICGASAYRTCTAGVLSMTCDGFLDPLAAEVCNGEDDDCDGTVDEALPSTTFGEGRCAETLSCVGGALVTTSPAVPAGDGCEGPGFEVDEDCDGRVDEDCVPDDCVFVRTSGSEGEGTPTLPFGRLSDGIRVALERGTGRVCLLASGAPASCSVLSYTMPTQIIAGDLTIVGGLVASEAGVVSECSQGAEATGLSPMNGAGIAIPSGLTLTLRDLVVRHPVASSGTVQALEVRTEGTLVMHNVRVRGSDAAGVASLRRGVLVRSGGTFVAHASRIESGPAATAYAIDATDATVALLEGCGARGCVPSCTDLNHGLATNRPGAALRHSGGELLIDRVAVCVDRARTGLEVSGAARATVARSYVEMGPELAGDVRGVNGASCTSLWVHDTRVAMTVGASVDPIDSVVGIDATSCPALISDDEVVGVRTILGSEVGMAYGLRCNSTACTVTGNVATGASSGEGVLEAFGLACVNGCSYVAQNTFLGAGVFTQEATGMLLESTRATVTRNRAVGGCGELVVGTQALGGGLRLTNNEMSGVRCDAPPSFAAGLAVEGRTGASFTSHGNSYDAGRLGGADVDCSSAGLALRAEARFGSFVNDVLVAGECAFARAAVVESRPPFVFSHAGLVGSYYEVVDDRVFADAASLAAAYPLFVGHVFTSTPRFVDRPASLRIQATSPFAGAGTRLGGPRVDFDGSPRPSPPSIGAWEP